MGVRYMRKCGILMPVFSLPSRYGIGCFSKEAYEFVDRLKAAGQKYWQILPLGPTSYGDSPYQSFSAYAGNPYFIDLDQLKEEGLLDSQDCELVALENVAERIDYARLYHTRFRILKRAFFKFNKEDSNYQNFLAANREWLEDYSLFMALKDKFEGKSWIEWEDSIKNREEAALHYYQNELREEIEFYSFVQFKFKEQWNQLKAYANDQGIQIIGDIPIYVAFDSADSWANKELFQFNEDGLPSAVAGCPPDAFAKTGQLWGNPLYRWEYHKETDYEWWTKRIAYCFQLYDVVRVDHFRGFDEYYSIPYGEKTAENGCWKEGPGFEIFETMFRKLGKLEIIAEDLGYLTESVIELVKKTGYPGMKILQFAFDSREESDYLPHNYEHNCVVYPGTHDNDTIMGWYQSLKKEDKDLAIRYVGLDGVDEAEIPWYFIRLAMQSVADYCIIAMQDYLGLGSEARINIPSTVGDNWRWRMSLEDFDSSLCERIKLMAETYRR